MSTPAYDYISDHDMQCPGDWYGGFKEGIVQRFGEGERALSHIWTGDWQGSTFTVLVNDHRRRYRQRLSSPTDRFWVGAWQIFMTTRANRAALGTPYTVFVGPVIDAQPRPPLAFEFTLGDIVSQSILSDQHQLPWRLIRDCGLMNPDGASPVTFTIAESLDLDQPEPMIYGKHRRIASGPDATPASPDGFEVTPIYLGIEARASGDWHVWLVSGHACGDVPDVNVVDNETGVHTTVIPDEGVKWLIPHWPGHLSEFGLDYRDIRSFTFGNDRRYTFIYGKVGQTDPDACALGEKTLTCFVDGVEPNADGSGVVITDRLEQYKHFLINYVANYGRNSYQSGAWLDNPTWDLFDGPVTIVEETSFDDCAAIALERLPAEGSPAAYPGGYIGAAVIGARAGDRASVKKWIADWNRSCSVRFGVTHFGQLRVVMLHPTQAIKDAAPLYVDQYEMLQGSFVTEVLWRDHANRVPFIADFDYRTGRHMTSGVAEQGDSIQNYGREILGQVREYPFAPGITMSYHLARLESLVVKHPPRVVSFEAPVGPDYNNESLGYLDLGDYIRYLHYAEVGSPGEIRLGQVITHQVQSGRRRVRVDVLDCDDLLDYDLPPVDAASGGNATCGTAIEITQLPFTPFAESYDTSTAPQDTSISGSASPPNWSGTEAYAPAWFKYTPPANGTLLLSTVFSDYDTQMAVFTGACGSLTEVAYNDNDPTGLQTSVLEIPVTAGTEYHILVAGYGPNDGGQLTFSLYFSEPEP